MVKAAVHVDGYGGRGGTARVVAGDETLVHRARDAVVALCVGRCRVRHAATERIVADLPSTL
jgi:hypothetical protein